MFFEPESNLVTMFMPLCAILLEFWDSPLLSIFKLTNSGMKFHFFFNQRTYGRATILLLCNVKFRRYFSLPTTRYFIDREAAGIGGNALT